MRSTIRQRQPYSGNRAIRTVLVLATAAVAAISCSCIGNVALLYAPDKTYRSAETTPTGKIDWDIIECSTGKSIGHGSKTLVLNDIVIVEHLESSTFYDKRIDLEQGFYVAMSEFPENVESDVGGFGMVAEREGHDTFCWEWFEVDSRTHATKLQESGALEITTRQVGSRWEIGSTKFLTNVSFRLHPDGVESVLSNKPKWRVNILKGSEIMWPSLVGGKVMANDMKY